MTKKFPRQSVSVFVVLAFLAMAPAAIAQNIAWTRTRAGLAVTNAQTGPLDPASPGHCMTVDSAGNMYRHVFQRH